jgi:catechol 2,3-dioxygenase-like lactoylglutathione lyase family enzyme
MAVHRLTSIVLGVPDPPQVADFYRDFGLQGDNDDLASERGGEQLHLESTSQRALLELGVGVDDVADLDAIETRVRQLGHEVQRQSSELRVTMPGTTTRISVTAAPRLASEVVSTLERDERRSQSIEETDVVPGHLGHVVLSSTDSLAGIDLLTIGLGFAVSDRVGRMGAFLSCSDEHHNIFVNQSPVAFMHHAAWSVESVDDIGMGATRIIKLYPDSNVWGLGRHLVGSNVFWYLKDPAGNFCEYYSDMDRLDRSWEPKQYSSKDSLYCWGMEPPEQFIRPIDIAW